ncbi:MAG: hypothetical protein OEV40_05835 [Acidimicrobiia bacterium]|nr:hypothetical protein [Acidimicrobiia bacterium]
MSGSEQGPTADDLTTTVRVDRPDGTSTTTVRTADGRIEIDRRGSDGEVVGRFEIELASTGVVVIEHPPGHSPAQRIEPASVEVVRNLYGATVETVDYPGLAVVENTLDNDGSLRSVALRGEWGTQDVELVADGSRVLSWDSLPHCGRARWDAGDRLEHFDVTFADATGYRWDLLDGEGRAQVVDWSGRTTTFAASPPIAEPVND